MKLLPIAVMFLGAWGLASAQTAPATGPAGKAPEAAAAAPAPKPAPPAKPAADQNGIRVLLAPALETTLVSQSGGRVREVAVTHGSSFPKGKVLVRFDCDEQAARLRIGEAELVSAREMHEAKLRLQGLDQANDVEVALAASSVEKAKAQIGLYRAQMSQCTIAAPFAGRVVKIVVKPHQGVTPGQTLLEIISDGPLKLRLNAPAKWISWLKPGTRFEVKIDETGKSYMAKVTAINGRIDAVAQTIELEAAIEEIAPDLLAGMSGVARFNPPQ